MKKFLILAILFLFPIPYTLFPIHAQIFPDENAIENINNGTLPTEISKNIPDNSNIQPSVLDQVINVFGFVIGSIQRLGIFTFRAGVQHQAEIPTELKPKSGNILDVATDFLGKKTGVYTINLPKEVLPDKILQNFENSYEKANFPEGVNPITK